MKKVSIIVCTYNRLHTLPQTLESLSFLRYPHFEVIVVNGPSCDGTDEYLQNHWEGKIKLYRCPETNLAQSRNIGIVHAAGDILCFIDDDAMPEPDWLNELIPLYDDPQVGAVGGWVRDHQGVEYQAQYILSSIFSKWSNPLIQEAATLPEGITKEGIFLSLIGVNSSFRTSAVWDVGGFDEHYRYFLEETDVCLRLWRAGYTIRVTPAAEVHHKFAPSHLRTPHRTIHSWTQILSSTAYYILRSAPVSTPLFQLMETIERNKQERIEETHSYLSQGHLSPGDHHRLLEEISLGVHTGILEVFQQSNRRLLSISQTGHQERFLPFHRALDSQERLRLAFVPDIFPPKACGGIAVFMMHLARELARLGHEITIIVVGDPGEPHTVDFEEGVWVHRIPPFSSESQPDSSLPFEMPNMPPSLFNKSRAVFQELNRMEARRQFDGVVGTLWDMTLAVTMASKKYPTFMYLVTSYQLMRDSKPQWTTDSNFYHNFFLPMVCLEKWGLTQETHLLASTQMILKDVEEAYEISLERDNLSILPFGLPCPTVLPSTTYPTSQESPFSLSLLFVGRLEKRKGIDLLLEIAPRLLTTYPFLSIVCVGDDTLLHDQGKTYKQEFTLHHQQAAWLNRIQFLGHVDEETLIKAYETCDLFVAPSRYESFGLIYLEAMRYGKPCIGTTAGGIPEIIIDGVTGLLAKPGDAASLHAALETLIQNPELRCRMGQAGQNRYRDHFTIERFAKNFETLIREKLGKNSLKISPLKGEKES